MSELRPDSRMPEELMNREAGEQEKAEKLYETTIAQVQMTVEGRRRANNNGHEIIVNMQGEVGESINLASLLPNADWKIIEVQGTSETSGGLDWIQREVYLIRGINQEHFIDSPYSLYILLHEIGHTQRPEESGERPQSRLARLMEAAIEDQPSVSVSKNELDANRFAIQQIRAWQKAGWDFGDAYTRQATSGFLAGNIDSYALEESAINALLDEAFS